MLKTLRSLLAADDKAVEVTPTSEPMRVESAVRLPPGCGPIDLTLGKRKLRLYPEMPTTAGGADNAGAKNWLLLDPERFFSGIDGFLPLKCGETTLVGRANESLDRIFQFPKSVTRRHIALGNQDGEIVITPLDCDRETYLSSAPKDEGSDWMVARRVKNLKRIRKIFGGPIELLEPEAANATLEQVHAILLNEAHRPKDSRGQPGGLLDLPRDSAPVVVGDIHAQLDNLLKILSLEGCLDGLKRRDTYLLFLGDLVHREGDNELEEMDSSLLTLDLIFKLKIRFPESVFFLRGNHEDFGGEVGKGGVPQGRLLWQHARTVRGKGYAKRLAECFDLLAYVARSKDFVACHAGPPRRSTPIKKLIDIHSYPNLAREIVWNRLRRTGRPDGYAKRDVKAFRETLGADKGAPFIVSHTPLSNTDVVWTDAADIPGHHIIYCANPSRFAVFIRSGQDMIPTEYASEPLLDFVNALPAEDSPDD